MLECKKLEVQESMSWKPIDFHGIMSLDSPLVELLNQYLEEKEALLSQEIVTAMPKTGSTLPDPLPNRLTEAIEWISRSLYQNRFDAEKSTRSIVDWNKTTAIINNALWDYVDIIDGCTTEFFQQLEQISLEQWHTRLAQVVSEIKESLLHRMENLIWAIKRLEDLLYKYQAAHDTPSRARQLLNKLTSYWTSLLDSSLLSHLDKDQRTLKEQYHKFLQRYEGYLSLLAQAEQSLKKLSSFTVLTSLYREPQEQFLKLYQLLKLWEYNRMTKVLPSRELLLAIRNETHLEKATALFREYYKGLRADLFSKSLSFKTDNEQLLSDPSQQSLLTKSITDSQAETALLGSTINQYREFLLHADPDPYVRTRLGFSEWTAGVEPAQLKPLIQLGYDVEALSDLFSNLKNSIENIEENSKLDKKEVENELQEILHEMGQPLATYRDMRYHAEHSLELIEKLNELGSFDPGIIDYIDTLLTKLLRIDWRYHVLHGIPQFHQIYAIHKGYTQQPEDRQRMIRTGKFQALLNKLTNDLHAHREHYQAHEIDLDKNDLKSCLQDFLAYVQRICSETSLEAEQAKKHHTDIAQELLEYRYLFGNFIYQLRQTPSKGIAMRKQFLFVDQYFESVDYKLYELSKTFS